MKKLLLSVMPVFLGATLMWACGSDLDHEHGDDGDGGAETSDPAASGIINEKCPIMGKDVDAAFTVEYEGKKVAFCCEDCIPDWNALSEAEKASKLEH